MNKKIWVYLETIMLIIWVITLIIFLSQIWTDGSKCKSNPLVFGVKYLEIKNNDTFTCNCKFESKPDYTIFIDSKHWELQNPVQKPINLEWEIKK